MKTLSLTAVAAAALLAACATVEDDGPQGMAAIGDPARAVPVAGETVVTTDPEVDADDPALWADARDPSRAVMFGTDKTDGLYVHNLDGSVRQFLPSGQLNNVDLRTGFEVNGREMVLVAATNDTPGGAGINFYLFDPDTLQTVDYDQGFVATVDGVEPANPDHRITARRTIGIQDINARRTPLQRLVYTRSRKLGDVIDLD